MRHLIRGVKSSFSQGVFAVTTVAEFMHGLSTMYRLLQECATLNDRRVKVPASTSPFDDLRALQELVRSVIREALQHLHGGDHRPTFATTGEAIRDEVP